MSTWEAYSRVPKPKVGTRKAGLSFLECLVGHEHRYLNVFENE